MYLNEKLDHMPSSCIMVHMVVKGRQYSAYTALIQATSHLNRRDGLTIDLDTDN